MKAILIVVFLCTFSGSFGQSILEYLKSRPANFTYAVQALTITNLTDLAQNGGPYTIFVPTDNAFNAIPPQILQRLLADPQALKTVLLAHVTNGQLISPFLKPVQNEISLANTSLNLTKDSHKQISVNGVKVVDPDHIVDNGVVHAIEFVFNMPAAKENMVEYLLKHPDDFKDLTAALTIAGLLPALEGNGPFTLFAPTNAAFQKLSGTLQSIASNPNLFKDILKYHVVSGIQFSGDLTNGLKLETLLGKNLTVSTQGGIQVDHSHVIKPDYPVVNGVVHVIDAVMVPNA